MGRVYDDLEKIDTSILEVYISQYEQFEEDGEIGECELRSAARKYEQRNIVWWMREIAFESYRILMRRYKKEAQK